jgi:nitrate/TMAO reductase-like tetraheme cytochrome c subunit
MKLGIGRWFTWGTLGVLAVAGLAVGLVTAAGIKAWEYSNSNAFCTNACHAVHPEEPVAHAASSHARVNCVECHMGRVSTLELMLIKPTHVNELWGMIVGYERPIHTHSLRPARDSCEACHYPQARHSDTVRTKVHYDNDPKSRETRTTLVMHTGVGEVREANTKGIHWHIVRPITYVATDPAKQKIPWIQATTLQGKTITWYDPTSGVTPQAIEKLEKRTLDCIDCHNAVGHPFPNPSQLVDDAIRDERISRKLPAVKLRADALIKATEKVVGTEAERAAQIDKAIAANAPKDLKPDLAKAEAAFREEMKKVLLRTSFAADITWKTFPSNTGHRDFPGCFRCHDGKHLDDKGEAIRLQCTLCHALPKVVREDGTRSVVSTVSPDLTPPPSHEEPNFMHEHRTKVDDSCKMCHGKIEWGTEGGSFCSNPACHGRKWPEMNLDAKAAPVAAPAAPAPAAKSAPKKKT